MTDSPCPCRYDESLGAIVFCNLHSAAEELLEAGYEALQFVDQSSFVGIDAYERLKAALARAEGSGGDESPEDG